jgi:hypothetical protein
MPYGKQLKGQSGKNSAFVKTALALISKNGWELLVDAAQKQKKQSTAG